MSSQIAPAITVESIEQYKAETERIAEFASRVHIDISDGEFAPTFLIGVDQLYWPEGWQVDVHAMVMRPSEYMPQILKLNPSTVIFHAEASEDLLPHFAALKAAGIRAGVALLKKTVPSSVEAVIKEADHVMIFSGELGKHGGTASMMQLEKVRLIKRIKPEVEIGWDGGITIDNIYTVSKGGVHVINVGGALANAENPITTYNQLETEMNKQGVI